MEFITLSNAVDSFHLPDYLLDGMVKRQGLTLVPVLQYMLSVHELSTRCERAGLAYPLDYQDPSDLFIPTSTSFQSFINPEPEILTSEHKESFPSYYLQTLIDSQIGKEKKAHTFTKAELLDLPLNKGLGFTDHAMDLLQEADICTLKDLLHFIRKKGIKALYMATSLKIQHLNELLEYLLKTGIFRIELRSNLEEFTREKKMKKESTPNL